MPKVEEKPCTGKYECAGTMYWEKSCGAMVCNTCNHHDGLARCFCGWAADGGNGREQLEEMGETIEPEDGGFFEDDSEFFECDE